MFGAPVPEAAVEKDSQTILGEGHVRPNDPPLGADRIVLAEPKPAGVKGAAEQEFGSGVGTPDRGHVPRTRT